MFRQRRKLFKSIIDKLSLAGKVAKVCIYRRELSASTPKPNALRRVFCAGTNRRQILLDRKRLLLKVNLPARRRQLSASSFCLTGVAMPVHPTLLLLPVGVRILLADSSYLCDRRPSHRSSQKKPGLVTMKTASAELNAFIAFIFTCNGFDESAVMP